MGNGLLPVVIGGMLTGGPLLAYIALKKAPLERDQIRVTQSSTIADDALSLLEAERARFAGAVEDITGQLDQLNAELAATRRDRQHDRERCRQLTVANEALLAEVDACHVERREANAQMARLRAAAEREEPAA